MVDYDRRGSIAPHHRFNGTLQNSTAKAAIIDADVLGRVAMTELLEYAIARLQALPESEQDAIAWVVDNFIPILNWSPQNGN